MVDIKNIINICKYTLQGNYGYSFRCEHKIFSANLRRGPSCHEAAPDFFAGPSAELIIVRSYKTSILLSISLTLGPILCSLLNNRDGESNNFINLIPKNVCVLPSPIAISECTRGFAIPRTETRFAIPWAESRFAIPWTESRFAIPRTETKFP